MHMSKEAVRLMVDRQIRLEHPEYSNERLRREVDLIVDLIHQVQDIEAQSLYESWEGTSYS